jgi:DNA primase
MDSRGQKVSAEEARKMDMVEYLSGLGLQPEKIREVDYWYLSPLREEKTPSFKINRQLNRWYDHGLGQGGNIIDFAILYYNCTVAEFLQMLKGSFSFHQQDRHEKKVPERNEEAQIKILQEKPLSSFPLYRYLQQRKISLELAQQYCLEVRYELNHKEFFGIGFKNNSGGFEIRNPYFKASSSPKDLTIFNNGRNQIAAFEGFLDFLSYLTLSQGQPPRQQDYVVLNSLSFFEKARPFLEEHQTIQLYLDRDAAGQNFTRYALSLSKKYEDKSKLYRYHKDLNDWIVNREKVQNKNLGKKLR